MSARATTTPSALQSRLTSRYLARACAPRCPRRAARVPGRTLRRVALRRRGRHVVPPRVAPAPRNSPRRTRRPAGHDVYDIVVSPANPDMVLAAVGKDGGAERRRHLAIDGRRRPVDPRPSVRAGHGGGHRELHSMAPDRPTSCSPRAGTRVARSLDGGVLTWSERVAAPDGGGGERCGTSWPDPRGAAPTRLRGGLARVVTRWTAARRGKPIPSRSRSAAGRRQRAGARSISVHPENSARAVRDDVRSQSRDQQRRRHRLEGDVRTSGAAGLAASGPSRWISGGTVPPAAPGSCVPNRGQHHGQALLVASPTAAPCRTGRRRAGGGHGLGAYRGRELPPRSARVRLTRDLHPAVAGPGAGLAAPGALLVNDGGANISRDGCTPGPTAAGLSTLGIGRTRPSFRGRRSGAAICMGMGDNFGFASPDGGLTWETQRYLGGDNDCAFSDPRQSSRVVVFRAARRQGRQRRRPRRVHLYESPDGSAPDTSQGTTEVRYIPARPRWRARSWKRSTPRSGRRADGLNAAWNVVSFFSRAGLPAAGADGPRGETAPSDTDFIAIRFTDGLPSWSGLTKLSRVTDAQFWETNATADGPNVGSSRWAAAPATGDPRGAGVGRPPSPAFYVGDQRDNLVEPGFGQRRVWRGPSRDAGWQQIVPRPAAAGGAPAPSGRSGSMSIPIARTRLRPRGRRTSTGPTTAALDVDGRRRSLERPHRERRVPLVLPYDGNPGPSLCATCSSTPTAPASRSPIGPAGVFQTLDGRHGRPDAARRPWLRVPTTPPTTSCRVHARCTSRRAIAGC